MSPPAIIQVEQAGHTYPVLIGALESLVWQDGRGVGVIITNPRVGKLHAARVTKWLRANGIPPRLIAIPDGERYKTLNTARAVYDQLLDARCDRHTTIFALGGGVVNDLAGFVAATYLRGIAFVPIPTTLLAMVDASIGGKVGVDHPRGKNLIGAFKLPRAVIADPNTLNTLPEAEWRAGMAEVVKHGIIGDVELFEELEDRDWRLETCPERSRRVGEWLARAIQVKVDIVTRDPFENSERLKLNLGHTFAHALEHVSRYRMRHGEAVAIGLVAAARLATRLGLCEAALATRVENLLRSLGLPTRVPRGMPLAALNDAMTRDKKRVGTRMRFVLPRALGDVVIVDDVSRAAVRATWEELRA